MTVNNSNNSNKVYKYVDKKIIIRCQIGRILKNKKNSSEIHIRDTGGRRRNSNRGENSQTSWNGEIRNAPLDFSPQL